MNSVLQEWNEICKEVCWPNNIPYCYKDDIENLFIKFFEKYLKFTNTFKVTMEDLNIIIKEFETKKSVLENSGITISFMEQALKDMKMALTIKLESIPG